MDATLVTRCCSQRTSRPLIDLSGMHPEPRHVAERLRRRRRHGLITARCGPRRLAQGGVGLRCLGVDSGPSNRLRERPHRWTHLGRRVGGVEPLEGRPRPIQLDPGGCRRSLPIHRRLDRRQGQMVDDHGPKRTRSTRQSHRRSLPGPDDRAAGRWGSRNARPTASSPATRPIRVHRRSPGSSRRSADAAACAGQAEGPTTRNLDAQLARFPDQPTRRRTPTPQLGR